VVLAASQLNRASKDSALPTLRGLRDSGVVEQAADGCLLLHRPDHDDPEATAQLLIAKNRWGELGALDLVPDLQNHRFGWRSFHD
jgi:replicative DNA helicase